MTTKPDSSQTKEESQEPQTWDDKQAYIDFSSQNEAAKQFFLVFSAMGVSYSTEVIHAYSFLKKEKIDPQKLIDDPVYKREVARCIQLVKRHEGDRLNPETGKSKCKDTVQRTSTALNKADFAYDQQVKTKTNYSKYYSPALKTAYGFDDKEAGKIIEKTLDRIAKNPNLSLQEACRQEARFYAREKINQQMKKDKVDSRAKEGIAKTRLATQDAQFNTATHTTHLSEQQACGIFSYNGKIEAAKALGIELELPPQQSPLGPQSNASTMAPTTGTTIKQPIVTTITTKPLKIPSFVFNFKLPQISLPKISFRFPKISLPSGLGSLFNKGKSFLSDKLDPIKLAGKEAINAAIDGFLPGAGRIIGGLNEGIKNITGVDIEGTIIEWAKKLTLALIALLTLAPVAVGVLVYFWFSSSIQPNTSANPLMVTSAGDNNTSWLEFVDNNLKVASNWDWFEKENLSFQKTLSLDSYGHN